MFFVFHTLAPVLASSAVTLPERAAIRWTAALRLFVEAAMDAAAVKVERSVRASR